MQLRVKLQFLKLPNNKVPFLEWLESLDIKTQLNIRNRLTRIELGNYGDCKVIGKGVSELRIHYGSGYRVFFGKKGNEVVLIINGGNKGSQKRDIAKAQEYWKDYLKGGYYDAN
jgi:putative addiction module killer protein